MTASPHVIVVGQGAAGLAAALAAAETGKARRRALAVTLIVEVPIDNQIEAWTVASLPSDWQQLRDRWELFHVIRTWVSVIGLAFLLVGALLVGGNSTVERRSVDTNAPREPSL